MFGVPAQGCLFRAERAPLSLPRLRGVLQRMREACSVGDGATGNLAK